ncbi:hypothetical protein ANN_03601 [Periplaneta americana]|uniref:Uncharacterized protein n=1 Tax=Periplaneta americana TaxID=6978 RepID=A0ABQ8U538_PERAM|nr:hypothetical protein ANN_03601 [Periplaneta americana]
MKTRKKPVDKEKETRTFFNRWTAVVMDSGRFIDLQKRHPQILPSFWREHDHSNILEVRQTRSKGIEYEFDDWKMERDAKRMWGRWLFNEAASTTGLFCVDEIGDSEMVFDEMRSGLRHRLPEIRLMVGENLGKVQPEEQRLRVFENKVLRKIFGAKRDEVTGEWRKLHNAELHALYSSPDIISNIKSRRLRWAGHVAHMGESRNAYRVLVGRPEGKIPLGRPRRRWEDYIKLGLREVGYDDREWINLAQDRDRWRADVRAAMNLRVP